MVPDTEHRRRFDLALDAERHPLDRLLAVRQLRAQLDRIEREAVREARARQFSMAAVARALGVSRQAVHQRLGDIECSGPEPETAADRWWRERRELEERLGRMMAAWRADAAAAPAHAPIA